MVVTASYVTEVWLEQFPNSTCWYAFDATGIWSVISEVEKVSIKHVGSGFLALSYLNMKGDEKHGIAPALKHQLLLCFILALSAVVIYTSNSGVKLDWFPLNSSDILSRCSFFFFSFADMVRLYLTKNVFGC